MKTYRNEHYCFEIYIPDGWTFHTASEFNRPSEKGQTLIFRCQPEEAFNIRIEQKGGSSMVVPALWEIENRHKLIIHEKGYSHLAFGRLTIDGKAHVWARYYLGFGQWVKKFTLFFPGVEYTLTATCNNEKKLLEMEKTWDAVAASFQLLPNQTLDKAQNLAQQLYAKAVWPSPEPLKSEPAAAPPATALSTQDQAGQVEPQAAIKKPLQSLKTYHNEKHGFEIDIPEAWQPAPEVFVSLSNALAPIPPGVVKDIFQYGSVDEAINFEIAPLFPDPRLDDTEVEFKLYARNCGFTDLHFGRIMVAGKEHVCAHYFINDKMGRRWNKKYMVVFGGIEYALTVTCNDPQWFAQREKDWDVIIQSFRLIKPFDDSANFTIQAELAREKGREVVEKRIELREALGDLYAKGYEAVVLRQYDEARNLLEACLRETPDHRLAHKELAVVLEILGDKAGALRHRQEAARLDPMDAINNAKLARLVAQNGQAKAKPAEKVIATPDMNWPVHSAANIRQNEKFLQGMATTSRQEERTLAFSSRAYLLIQVISYIYIENTVGIRALATLTDANHAPLSGLAFFVLFAVLYFGLGAMICEIFVIGMGFNEKYQKVNLPIFDFANRTMLKSSPKNPTIGAQIFSDYTRPAIGTLDALGLQVKSIFHALGKILVLLPLNIRQVNRLLILIIFFTPLIAENLLKHSFPLTWTAIGLIVIFWFCYRAFLSMIANQKGIETAASPLGNRPIALAPALSVQLQTTTREGVKPDLITKLLAEESIRSLIRNDLRKTRQIGYREVWKLGLITPDLDYYAPEPGTGPKAERLRKASQDPNYRLRIMECLPLKRTAVLHNPGMFNVQLDHLTVLGGTIKPLSDLYSGWSYQLVTKIGRGEFIPLRDIQIKVGTRSEIDDSTTIYRQKVLEKFLQEEGFPLKTSYVDGDPLTTERGGTLVLDRGKPLIIYPNYFIHRRLIDDEGNLVEIGLDESFGNNIVAEVKMRPSVSEGLFRCVQANHYTPVVHYRSIPYVSATMLPILDTPISASGWADLYIDPTGKGKLFISKEKTEAEWYAMLEKLRQLFFKELFRKNNHLLGLTKDKSHLNFYLNEKQEILKEYFFIQDWQLG